MNKNIFIILLIIFGNCAENKTIVNKDDLQKSEVDSLLAGVIITDSSWTIASNNDNQNSQLNSQLELDPKYQSYLSLVDIDKNGKEDLFYVLKKDTLFRLYFLKDNIKTNPSELILETNWLKNNCLFGKDNELLVGGFSTDDVLVFYWSPDSQKVKYFYAPDSLGD